MSTMASQDLMALEALIENANYINRELLFSNSEAYVKNALYLVDKDNSLLEAAGRAINDSRILAGVLESNGLFPTAPVVTTAKEAALKSAQDLRIRIADASPSSEAIALGIS